MEMRKRAAWLLGLICIVATGGYAATLDDALKERDNFNYRAALKMLESMRQSSDTAKSFGWIYLYNGRYDKAIELLGRDDDDYETLLGAGLTCYLKQDYEKSLEYLQKSLKANKHCAVSEYLSGNIKAVQGDQEGAVGHYTSALKLDYNMTEARLKLARLYLELKKYNEAYREWAKLADIDPQNKEAQTQKRSLLALITKKPEEIIPPSRITQATTLAAAPDTGRIPLMRIGVLKGVGELSFWSRDGFIVCEGSATVCEADTNEVFVINGSSEPFKSKRKLSIRPKAGDAGIIVRDIRYAAGYAWAGTSDREYRGTMEVIFRPEGITLVNLVNLEEYVYSVLPSEMISWWPEESLKVQAVITRTQSMYRKNIARLHSKDGYDLCGDQHCQVYKGVKQETAKARKMTDATRGEILEYDGRIVHTLFSSNCGGHTQSSKELKGWGDEPFLAGAYDGEGDPPATLAEFDRWIKHVPGVFCKSSQYTYHAESRWIRLISQEELSERLNRNHALGAIKKIIPLKRSQSGHINHLRIEGAKGAVEIEKENNIRAIALGRLRSTNFIVEGYGNNAPDVPEFFVFWGAGWGHAVGLCQSGVAGMSEMGYKYDAILKKYYKGSTIKKLDY